MQAILFDWPYLGLGLAAALVAWIALEPRPAGAGSRWRDPASVLPLLWPMYLVHQFEEHGVDALGRHYAFLGELCTTLGFGGSHAGCPGDPAFIFAVNAVGCQLTFAIALWFRRRNPLVAACAWGVALVNAATHIAGAFVHRAYNPGLLTSVVLFAPMCAWMLRTVIRAGVVQPRQVPRIVGAGLALHGVLIASLLLHEHGLISHAALLAINAVNGLMPLPFGLVGVRTPKSLA
jgi:hypothetical protein